jgi:hypothetical protein
MIFKAFKLFSRSLFFALLIFNGEISNAQKVTASLSHGDWHVQDMHHAQGNFYSFTSFKKSVISLPDGGFVAAVRFAGDNWGVVRVSAEGKKLWQAKTKGEATGIAQYKEDFLVTYNDAHVHTKAGLYVGEGLPRSKSTTAALINGSTGKIIKEKILHTSDKASYTDSRTLTQPDGQFSSIFLRVTPLDKSMNDNGKEMKVALSSERILLINFDGDFNPKNTEIHTPGKEELFMGAEGSKDGSFFLSFLTEDEIVVEQFQKDGKKAARLSSTISLKKFWNIVLPVLSINPLNPDAIFISLYYSNKGKDQCNQSFEFNFNTKRVMGSGEQELSRSYVKAFDFQEVKEKGIKVKKLKVPERMRVVDVLVSEGRIAVVKEMATSFDNFIADGVIIEIYDSKWVLQKTIALDRYYEINIDVGRTLGCRMNGSKLELIFPAIGTSIGSVTAKALYAKIDVGTYKLEEYKEMEELNIKKHEPLEGSASIWLSDGVFVESVKTKGGIFKGKKDFESQWFKVAL